MRSRIFMMLAIPTAVACGDTKTSSQADDTAMNTSDAADGESDGNPSEDAGAGDDEGTDAGESESGGTDDGSVDDGGAVEDTSAESGDETDGSILDTATTDGGEDTGVEGGDDTSADVEAVAPPEEDAIDLGFSYTCRDTTGGDEDPDSDPDYVPNRNGLCVVTSEVNWKIDEELIEGGDVAVALRDCIAEALQRVRSGVGDEKCIPEDESSFRDNETCWEALAEAEVECGGPEVDVSGDDPPAADPEPVGKSGPDGASGVLMLTNADKEIGHAVTAKSSPTPGPDGEWTIRDSEPPCQNVVLTIEMETKPVDESSESGGDEDPPETKTCVTECTPDPASRTECCDWLLTDAEGDPTEWCYGSFRKIRRKTPSGGDDPPPADTDPVEIEPG